MRLAPLPVIALCLGCAPAPPACPEAPPARPAPVATAAAAPAKAAARRLDVKLTPDVRLPGVLVEITAAGDAPLASWSIAEADAAAFHLDEGRDDRGPLASAATPRGAGVKVTFDRVPQGEIHVRYAVPSRPRRPPQPVAVDADPNRFIASGEALLLLPDDLGGDDVAVTVRIDPEPLGEGAGAASSFGFGAERAVSTGVDELRRATFFAGPVGRALFDAPEGHDEAAWLGFTAFDPRPVAADVAAFRTAAREIFRDKGVELHTLLIAPDARPAGAFAATRRARSVLVRLGVSEPWSAPVRIATATEVIHTWIGGRLWVGPEAPPGEAYWFTEGVARGFARDLLFRFGLLTPAELLDELNGLASVLATSPLGHEANAPLAARVREPGVVPVLVARGALYAARVDALVQKHSHGKRRLDDVLRALYEQARAKRAALPASTWVAAVEAEAGAAEGQAFASFIEQGRAIEVPEGAFGPCFRGEKRRYQAFDLGFDEEATRAAPGAVIAGLHTGGPAERAGVRAGDVLADVGATRGRSDVPVTLTVERAGEKKTFRYLPAGASASGPGWARRKEVGDEACAR